MILKDNSRAVLVIGPLPPPLGGVTIFLKRTIELLRRERRTVTHVDPVDLFKPKLGEWIKLLRRVDEILINSLNPWAILFTKALHPLAPIVVVDHNYSRSFDRRSAPLRMLQGFALSLTDRIVIVSPHLQSNYARLKHKIRISSPFVPPDLKERSAILSSYSDETLKLIDSKVKPVLVIGVWRPVEDDGQDLYGLSESIRLLKRISTHYQTAKLVVFVGELTLNGVWQAFCNEIESAGLSGSVTIEIGQKEMWPILERADLMVRLTSTDGNSVSIHEALWLGCPVVASDVVPRPDGVVIYRYGDSDDLEDQVLRALSFASDSAPPGTRLSQALGAAQETACSNGRVEIES